jgi:hypothetical protein
MRKIKRVLAMGAVLAMMMVFVALAPSAAAQGPLDGLSVPPADPAMAFITPTPDQPDYSARLQAFLQATVPETWNGQPVAFYSTLDDMGIDTVGLPTSAPAADPQNPNFIYQRFQNDVLFYNATDGTTSVLPLS